ncbi:FHA domain protein [Lyngbya aestuarii BL J]|uniref:FHA domain protein n=1 Tax=Lyngbya aestuarii BL J TaxID=1348334 RepID=U7QFV4_9CYAN|nr:FHA domain-containing protein [Lyngbya aestuarii]ERT05930.1 FHA domain protein [Lyngbya aestuarii BL J]
MITLILIHPTQPIPVNRWTFKEKSVIRIGRAKDNDIVIYNAVVSRHHLELWNRESGWEVVSFGTNGTYINNKPLNQFFIKDGMVICLGNSGPRLMVKFSLGEMNKTPSSDESKDSQGSQTLTSDAFTTTEDMNKIQQQKEVLAEEKFEFEIDDDDDDDEGDSDDNSTTRIDFLE